MGSKERVKDYCRAVTEQVRWKKAHETIAEELENHIEDQVEVFAGEGMDYMEATEAAVREMGDPYAVGLSLDRIHKPKAQGPMLLLAIALSLIGFFVRFLLIERFETSLGLGDDVALLLIGIAAMMLFYFMDFSLVGKYPMVTFSSLLLVSLLALAFSTKFLGKAYLNIGFFVDLGYLSLIYPVAIASLIYKVRNYGYKGIFISWLGIMGLNFILMTVPTTVGIMHMTVIGFALLLISANRTWFGISKVKGIMLSSILAVATSSMFVAALAMNERTRERLAMLLFPWRYKVNGMSLQLLIQELVSSGKLIGPGSGVDTGMLTSAGVGDIWTDNIVAYSIYTYGWLPVVMVIGLLVLFLAKGVIFSMKQKSILGLLVSLSIVLSIAMQVINYLLYNVGIGISGTLSLPFISYSHTALIINFALTGLMLSVFRNGDEVRDTSVSKVGTVKMN